MHALLAQSAWLDAYSSMLVVENFFLCSCMTVRVTYLCDECVLLVIYIEYILLVTITDFLVASLKTMFRYDSRRSSMGG